MSDDDPAIRRVCWLVENKKDKRREKTILEFDIFTLSEQKDCSECNCNANDKMTREIIFLLMITDN